MASCQPTSMLTDIPLSRASSLPHLELCWAKMPQVARPGAFCTAWKNSAIAGQQRWFFAPWTAWQLIQLFRRREAIGFRFLVHDLRLVAARVLHGGFLTRLVVTGRTARAGVVATGLAVTRGTVAWAAALGRWRAGGRAIAVAWTVLATLWLAATRCTCTSALCRGTWTATATLGRFLLWHVVDAVTEVIDIVVQELVRGTIGCCAGAGRCCSRAGVPSRGFCSRAGRSPRPLLLLADFSLPLSLPLSLRPPPPPPPFGPSPRGPRALRGLRTSGRSRTSGFSASMVLASKPIRSPSAIFAWSCARCF